MGGGMLMNRTGSIWVVLLWIVGVYLFIGLLIDAYFLIFARSVLELVGYKGLWIMPFAWPIAVLKVLL
jgi:hypothetical protein